MKSIEVDKPLPFVLPSTQPGSSWSASFTVWKHHFRRPEGRQVESLVRCRLSVTLYRYLTAPGEYTRLCTRIRFLYFFRAISALQHSGCCSASLHTHHPHFTGARLYRLAITTDLRCRSFSIIVPCCDGHTCTYIHKRYTVYPRFCLTGILNVLGADQARSHVLLQFE